MAYRSKNYYRPSDYGPEEEALYRKYILQKDDAKNYFTNCIKPRLDRSYKLYIAYNGDRALEIKKWQANVFIPYVHGVVETLIPRVLDARPEFTIQGRNEDDQLKATKLQNLMDYTWEVANMDPTVENLVRSSLIYGTGYLQVSWKKDVREQKFLKTKDLAKKKYKWEKKEQIFYDAPYAEHIDNYCLWYDWHNIARESKQYWFKRLLLTGAEIKRRYPMADKDRLAMAFEKVAIDTTDYASIRNNVKLVHEKIIKGSDYNVTSSGFTSNNYANTNDPDLKIHEVFEWWRPFDDAYSVMTNDVPILDGAAMPIPFDFKEVPFIDIPYLKLPGEFEGYGLPMILENPQVMLNMVKNQRLDAVTLNIHKMWVVNPLANIDKNDLVTRPFGIVYSSDPNGVKEIQFSDVKASSYKEEELLKADMRYASGVDDFSMGVGGGAGSATEIRHLRESTLERVRLFVNHLGDGFSKLMRYWITLYKQFSYEEMMIRIIGEDGKEQFPLIEKDDLNGSFDFKASVIPSIAGKNDIDKKQNMDLFQLLVNLPFVDPRKLTSKVLHSWNWSLDSVAKNEEMQPSGPPGMEGQVSPEMAGMVSPEEGATMLEEDSLPPIKGSGDIPRDVIQQALAMLPGQPAGASPFAEASSPINLLQTGGLPPTAPRLNLPTSNPRGLNRGGRVNTNIKMNERGPAEGNLLNQANNIQR